MEKMIDYSRMRVSSRNRIVKCPVCGKRGEIHHYVGGGGYVIHRKVREGILWTILSGDYCDLIKTGEGN